MSETSSGHSDWPADTKPSQRWSIYTRGNVGEVYPEVVLPLEWAIGGGASERGWRQGAERIGFVTPEDYGPGEFVVLGVFGGYAYFNASLIRLLGVRTPGVAVDVVDTQFLGDADVPGYSPTKSDKNLRASAKMVRTAAKTMLAKDVPLVEEMRARADAYRAEAPPMDVSDAALWRYVLDGLDGLWEYMIGSHVVITMQATIAAGALTDFCEKNLGDPNLAVVFMTGIGDVVSAQPAKALWSLANETSPEEFDAGFQAFLAEFGHRGPNEFSLLGRDWAAFPELALTAVNTMRGVPEDRSPASQTEKLVEARDQALSQAKAKLNRAQRWQLDRALTNTAMWSRAREESKDQVIRSNQPSRHAYLELVRRAQERGGVSDRFGPALLSEEEFVDYVANPAALLPVIEERRVLYEHLKKLEPPFAFDAGSNNGGPPPVSGWVERATSAAAAPTGTVLTGAAGSPGVARGKVRIVLDPGDPAGIQPGEIMVAPLTDPSWTPLFMPAGGVVVEVGAAMSHSMIVSRELGIPCVVGVEDATLQLPDGALIEIDGHTGTVTVL